MCWAHVIMHDEVVQLSNTDVHIEDGILVHTNKCHGFVAQFRF